MESFLFLPIFFLFLIFWIYLLRYSGIKILSISIPGFLIIILLVTQYFGFPIIFYFLDGYRAQYVQDRSIILTIFLVTSYSITFIILGFILAKNKFGPLHSKDKFVYKQNLVVQNKLSSRLMLYLLFIISLIVSFNYISKIGLNNIASLASFNFVENNVSLKELRSNMTNAFDGNYHWYRLFMRDFLSIASVTFFGFYLLEKKFFYFIIFTLSFFISLFLTTITTEKAPLIWYLISLFSMYVLIRQDGQFKVKQIIGFGFLALLLTGYLYVNFMGSQEVLIGIKNAFSRVVTGKISALCLYFEIFPEEVGFLGGRSFPNPGGIFPYEPLDVTTIVHDIAFPEYDMKGIKGSTPTIFIGELYANFGYFAIILPPIFIGYLLYFINIIYLKLPKNPIVLSFFIWMVLFYSTSAMSSFFVLIFNIRMMIVVFVFIIIISIPYNFKIKYYKN